MKINSFLSQIFNISQTPAKMNWTGKQTKVQIPFTLRDKNLGKLKVRVKDTFIKPSQHDEITISINKNKFSSPLAIEKLDIFKNKNI